MTSIQNNKYLLIYRYRTRLGLGYIEVFDGTQSEDKFRKRIEFILEYCLRLH